MRRMADSIYATNLPVGWDLYAGYVDGSWGNSYGVACARFGIDRCVPIAVFSSTNAGTVGDCENGDMTPPSAVSWVKMRRAAGIDPTIYCSLAIWDTVKAAFISSGTPEPHYWIAAYPGNGTSLYPGAVAHQYADMGQYDASVVADYWPGVDRAPKPQPLPPPTNYPGDNVTSYPVSVAIAGGKGWIPSPVPTARIVSVSVLTENPDVVGRYDVVPSSWAVATQAGKQSPNGAVVVEGPTDGTYGVVLWAVG